MATSTNRSIQLISAPVCCRLISICTARYSLSGRTFDFKLGDTFRFLAK